MPEENVNPDETTNTSHQASQNDESSGDWKESNQGFWSKYKLLVIIGGAVLIIVLGVVAGLVLKKDKAVVVPAERQPITKPTVAQPAAVEEFGYLSLLTDKSNFAPGEEFKVAVMMDTNNFDLSAASAILTYDEQVLEAVKIDTSQSVMSFSAEKKIKDGQIRIVRGEPGDSNWQDSDDGFNGQGILAEIVFKAKSVGQAKVEFIQNESKMILDDGMGTGMKVKYADGEYRVGE